MGLWQDKTRKDWRYSFEYKKKVYAGGGCKTKAAARAAREERRKEVKAQSTTPIAMGFLEISNLYLDWSQRRHAKKTYQYKEMVYRLFIEHWGDMLMGSITTQQIDDYLTTRPSNHNYNAHRKELSVLFTYARKKLKVITYNPCWDLEKMPVEKKEKRIPTEKEFLRLLAAAGPDERPLLLILTHTLARIDEILRLTWQDVLFARSMLVLRTRKNKQGEWVERYLGMNKDLAALLMSMWKRRTQDKWIFFNSKTESRYNRRPKLMKSLCKRAAIPHYGFHCIRHFVSTYLHDILKVPTGVLSGILGHENKRTTEIYLHSVDEAERDALQKLEGVFRDAGERLEEEAGSGKNE